MAISGLHKLPRIFTSYSLTDQALFDLEADAQHHLTVVLRVREGDEVRVFNGRDGEWLARVDKIAKKVCELACVKKLYAQPAAGPARTLLFAPIKKARMDFLIEKAVELGVTHLQLVLTQNTQTRTIKRDRLEKQIIAAAEQCERMDIPELDDPADLHDVLAHWPETMPLLACIARLSDTQNTSWSESDKNAGVLIGPEGGFTDDEMASIRQMPCVREISLSPNILRTETAAIAVLGCLGLDQLHSADG